jgi:hypothetical protein
LARAVAEAAPTAEETQAADAVSVRSQLTQVGAIVGTPGYLAPEQVGGQAVDARCDLFSLGCVLYQLCVGRLPFPARDTATALAAIATVQPKPPRELNPEVPAGLSQLIMQLLAKAPAQRPPSARHVAQAIERLEAQQLRRSVRAWALGGVGVAATAAIAMFFLRGHLWPAPPPPQPPAQPAAFVAPDKIQPDKIQPDKILASIVAELRMMPPAVPTLAKEDALADLSLFKGKSFDKYRVDYESWAEMAKAVAAQPQQYPVRSAVLKALKTLSDTGEVRIKEGYMLLGPTVADATKGFVMKAQQEPALFSFQLEQALEEYVQVGELLAADPTREPSDRWRAHYDHVRALLLRRMVFMTDYNYALAQIRSDILPELSAKSLGWKLTRAAKARSNEFRAKDRVTTLATLWDKIIREHAGTPWAMLAQRDRQAGLGMQWRPDPE